MQFKATLLYASLNKQSIISGVYRSMEESKRERAREMIHSPDYCVTMDVFALCDNTN